MRLKTRLSKLWSNYQSTRSAFCPRQTAQWKQVALGPMTRAMRWHPQQGALSTHLGPFWCLLAPGKLAGVSLHPSAPSKFYDWLDVGLLMGTAVSIFLWPHSIRQHHDVVQYDERNGSEAASEAVTECAVYSAQSSFCSHWPAKLWMESWMRIY